MQRRQRTTAPRGVRCHILPAPSPPLSADRILVVVDGLPLGGTERQVVELLRGLRRRGRYTAHLAVLDPGGFLDDAAAAAAAANAPVSRRTRYDLTVAAALWSYIRRTDVRAVHAVGWMSGLAGLAAARAARVPILNGSLRSAPQRLPWRDRISRWCAAHSDRIVANSRAGIAAFGFADDPRARVIVNGIDVDRLLSIVATPAPRPMLCMVANFNVWKDHDTVVRALPAIRAAAGDVELVFVGRDAGTLPRVRALVQELGVEPFVTVVEDCSGPESIVARSSVAVLASHVEGFSTAMLEYMALGKPVVASDRAADVAAIVRESGAGFIYPHASPHDLAAAVVTLLEDRAVAGRMGEAGRQQAAAFTLERMVDGYESLYSELLRR